MKTVRIFASGALLFSAVSAAAQNAPSIKWPDGAQAMVWHAGLQRVLMIDRAKAMWSWDGSAWDSIGAMPDNRSQFAVAYDARRDRLVIHGGGIVSPGSSTPQTLDDTWEWDRRTWKQVSTSGPGRRDHHSMVFDAARNQLVLFGGADTTRKQHTDTWTWNGSKWNRVAASGPPGRGTHRLVFDSKRKVVVMHGGYGDSDRLLNDTWEWDGRAWKQITTTTSPSVRFASRMAYDEARERVVLFGGRAGANNLGDTWEYDGRTWTQRDAAGPSLRNVHEMVYDQRARATLMFGGLNAPVFLQDFWSFNGAWKQIPRPDARAVGAGLVNGPHAVGYRVIPHWDRSRSMKPARDFEGRAPTGDRAVPMQISVWYPAQAGGTPMRIGEYWAIEDKNETMDAFTENDVTATAARIRMMASFPLGVEPPQATADSIRELRTSARRDAMPQNARFPLIVTGLGPTNFRLAEYLASYGYVVVGTPTLGTAAQQVNRVQVAIETHARNLETLQAVAAALPFVDHTRIALIGVNFDGLAALTSQMRNMTADAVVSLDGYETKGNSSLGLRTSPYFDVSRMRVPYLAFAQDNPPAATFAFNDSLPRQLKYSDRYAYVVRDLDHIALIDDMMIYPQYRAEQRLGSQFVYQTVKAFLDTYVKRDTSARAFLTRSAVANGFPSWLVKTELKIPALAPIPTPDEVEQIAMVPDVDRLRSIFLQARATDPSVRMFTWGDMVLYSFRFRHRPDVAIKFQELAVEAFPTSTNAANNLGNAYRDAGQMPKAIEWWTKALSLIDADPEIPPQQKAQGKTNMENKIRAARGS